MASSAARKDGHARALAFLTLRSFSALGAVANGFALTYGFSRIFEPHLFALFVFVGNLGVALWLFDLGLARVLYVRLRERHLQARRITDKILQLYSGSVVVLYIALVGVGAIPTYFLGRHYGHGLDLSMFFVFCALNLPAYALRQISTAVDRFVAFEAYEALRRAIHLGLIIALAFGFSLRLDLLIGNVVWGFVLGAEIKVLIRGGGLALAGPATLLRSLWSFLASNRRKLLWSAGYVGAEFYSYSYPPLLVPLLYGLGPTAIAFDTVYKVFRGTNVLLAAACEVAVPWQTRAHNQQDRKGMLLATLGAAGLALMPALSVCIVLLAAGDWFFGHLLGDAVIVPHALSVLVASMIMANWIQTVSNFTLVYTGFFAQIGRLALIMAFSLSLAAIYAIFIKPSIIGFTGFYGSIYALGAGAYLLLAFRLPMRVQKAEPMPSSAEANPA